MHEGSCCIVLCLAGVSPYLALGKACQPRKGEGCSVGLGLVQPLEHCLVELAVCSPNEEGVQLHTAHFFFRLSTSKRMNFAPGFRALLIVYLHDKLEVHILALGCGSVLCLVPSSSFKIDTLHKEIQVNLLQLVGFF